MSSLAQLMAGRKRDSPVWEYFEYDVASDKSVCKVTESGKPSCNIKMAGKNSSNLIAHLRRVHADAYKRYCENEQSKQNKKRLAVCSSITGICGKNLLSVWTPECWAQKSYAEINGNASFLEAEQTRVLVASMPN
jgi:hypothetical protein